MIEPNYLRAFGVIILLLVVINVVLARAGRKANAAGSDNASAKMPMLVLELPNELEDIKQAVGDLGDDRRTVMRGNLKPDSRLFIPSYTFFFLVMSWLLTQRHFPWALWLGLIAGVCAVGAAGFDYMENAHIRALLDTALGQTTQQMIDSTRYVSLCKWGLSFITMGLLSALFFWRSDYLVVLGWVYALTAVVGLTGLIYRPAIGWAFGLMGVGALMVITVFVFLAPKFLPEL